MREKNCGGEIEKGTGGLVGGLVGGESGHIEGAKVASGWGESGHRMGRKWSTNWPRGRKWHSPASPYSTLPSCLHIVLKNRTRLRLLKRSKIQLFGYNMDLILFDLY